MHTEKYPVRSDKKDLGEAEFPVYANMDEALNDPTYGLGEVKLLELLNAQVKTNAMNALRTSKTKGATKTALRDAAASEIVQEIADQQHQEVVGKPELLSALINRRAAEIDQRMKDSAASETEEDEDSSDDE